jgi:hypothetical protein
LKKLGQLRQRLRRLDAVRADIRRELRKYDNETYGELADRVADAGELSVGVLDEIEKRMPGLKVAVSTWRSQPTCDSAWRGHAAGGSKPAMSSPLCIFTDGDGHSPRLS